MENVLLVPWFEYLMTLGLFENWELQRACLEEVNHWKSRSLQVSDPPHFQGWASDSLAHGDTKSLSVWPCCQALSAPASLACHKEQPWYHKESANSPPALKLLLSGRPSHGQKLRDGVHLSKWRCSLNPWLIASLRRNGVWLTGILSEVWDKKPHWRHKFLQGRRAFANA